jgi:CheY-like chemotaxis protein
MTTPLVLVVDDDDDIRDTITLILEVEGYAVASSGDGLAALRWLEAHDGPSMILLDMMMPSMNGEEFLQELRTRPNGLADVPVVLLTGDPHAVEKAKILGAQACLQKPVELLELEETVRRFARRAA